MPPSAKKKTPAVEAFVGTCGWCIQFHQRQDRKGDCRRFPPQVLSADGDNNQYTVWPIVAKDEAACGEFKARTNA